MGSEKADLGFLRADFGSRRVDKGSERDDLVLGWCNLSPKLAIYRLNLGFEGFCGV